MYTKEFWDKVYEKQNWRPPRTEAEHQKNIISVIKKFLPEDIDWKQILDYWCGDGVVWEELLKDGANVDFAEISSKMVEMIRQRLIYSNELSSTLGDDRIWKAKVFNVDSPKDLPVENETYDYIVAWCVLHHIDPKYRKEFLDIFSTTLFFLDNIISNHSWHIKNWQFFSWYSYFLYLKLVFIYIFC